MENILFEKTTGKPKSSQMDQWYCCPFFLSTTSPFDQNRNIKVFCNTQLIHKIVCISNFWRDDTIMVEFLS